MEIISHIRFAVHEGASSQGQNLLGEQPAEIFVCPSGLIMLNWKR